MDRIVGQTLKNHQICLCREIVPVTARLNLCPTIRTMARVSLFEGDQKERYGLCFRHAGRRGAWQIQHPRDQSKQEARITC